jgi:hypothetical protein
MFNKIRTTDGCLKNSYHVTALHNAGDCEDCFRLLAKAFMKAFGIENHVEFGYVDE